MNQIRTYVRAVPQLDVQISGKTIDEKIFSIFKHHDVRFGPLVFVTGKGQEWLAKINYFTSKEKPLQYTLLGFPFKMRVPLKTSRTLPDMGEVLSLVRLYRLTQLIGSVYKPGAVITIFTEGGFGASAGIPEKDWKQYDQRLRELVVLLGFDKHIKVKKLSDMEKMKEFKKVFAHQLRLHKKAMKNKDPKFLSKVEAVQSPIFRLINSAKYPVDVLMDVYNDGIPTDTLSPIAKRARLNLERRVQTCICEYFSYLATRDELQFLEKTIPHYLALSVSPKPGRLGIIPIHKTFTVLPYHGVPVLDTNKHTWNLEYLIDIMRDSKHSYRPVHVVDDTDQEPFYYEKY